MGNERFFKLNLQVSIYRISYCSADATYDRVFAFISTNRNETLECHAFLCPKRKMVRNAAHLFKAFWREKERRTLSRICLIFQRHVYILYCTVQEEKRARKVHSAASPTMHSLYTTTSIQPFFTTPLSPPPSSSQWRKRVTRLRKE